MKTFQSTLLSVILLFGCTTARDNEQTKIIDNFTDLESNLGSIVVIKGIISQTHGAAGIYFNVKDLSDENAKCIIPQTFSGFDHGARVEIFGRLERTDCGRTRICTNVCDKYIIFRE